ncbi:MAG: hypothetical protein NTV04_12125, partial [Deltaproteobacteria bacterium]|nr:hypothetical protein [Deltaproteobacteria bacterium]
GVNIEVLGTKATLFQKGSKHKNRVIAVREDFTELEKRPMTRLSFAKLGVDDFPAGGCRPDERMIAHGEIYSPV